jgi:beta-galactosidase
MMSSADVKKLIAYVEAGGTLVSEARCGWVDERGFSSDIIPGGGLHEVLGCRESNLVPIPKTSTLIIRGTHREVPLLKDGDRLDTLFFEEGFELLGEKARVLAEYENGRPAIVLAQHGKGRAMIIGSFIGSAYHHFRNPNNGKFLAGLADWLRIARPVEVKVGESAALVEARLLEGEGSLILFGFNRSEGRAAAEFGVAVPDGRFSAVNLETKETVPSQFRDGRLRLAKNLEPGEVWVVLLKYGKYGDMN